MALKCFSEKNWRLFCDLIKTYLSLNQIMKKVIILSEKLEMKSKFFGLQNTFELVLNPLLPVMTNILIIV